MRRLTGGWRGGGGRVVTVAVGQGEVDLAEAGESGTGPGKVGSESGCRIPMGRWRGCFGCLSDGPGAARGAGSSGELRDER